MSFPAVGFAHDFESVSARLQIPPGWRLLHASGVDRVVNTWIARWTLMDLFILLLVALAAGRLYGWWAAVVAGVALGLTLVEMGAPRTIWFLVILAEALMRALPALRLVRLLRMGVWLILFIIVLPFAMHQARFGLHPGLEGGAAIESKEIQNFMSASMPLSPPEERVEPAGQAVDKDDEGGDVKKKGLGGKRAGLYGLKGPKDGWSQRAQFAQNMAQYDPSSVVQTGQSVPRWDAVNTAELTFNRPVARGQELRLYLLPPWLNSLAAFARVLLLAGLVWLLLRRRLRLLGGWLDRRPLLAGLLALGLLLLPAPALAKDENWPSAELLTELKSRVLETPECKPNCAAINELALEAVPGELRLHLKISAAARTAVALPGDASSWTPAQVRVNGKPAVALRRDDKGHLWLALEVGAWAVDLLGPLPGRDSVQIPLPQRPRHASGKARGFSVDGLHEDGAVDESLVLTREQKSAGDSRDESAAPVLPPFLRVERTLMLGLKWEVHTRVLRQTPPGSPVAVEIPLLAGESVTTPGIRVERERAAVSLSFGPTDSEVNWQSTLGETPTIKLRADPGQANRWSETWRMQV
ncbi:MAG TPA: hypothetical protein VF518_09830, partial [Polyangia bacterium]